MLGCDIVVGSQAESLSRMAKGKTLAVFDRFLSPTSDFASQPDMDLSTDGMEQAVRAAAGDDGAHFLEATPLATALLGDAIGTNLFLVGFAVQKGRLPVGLAALERAIELNGRAVELNKRALAWGRLAAVDPAAVSKAAGPGLRAGQDAKTETLAELVAKRADFLTGYQDEELATRYSELVELVSEAEQKLGDGRGDLARAVARYYFKLLAYKDEYEVARLYTDGSFRRQLEREFEGNYKLRLHLSPQFLPGWIAPRDDRGRVGKWTLGAWMFPLLKVLAALRFLRGTPFDVPGWTAHRRRERALIREYEQTIRELGEGLAPDNRDLAVEIATLPEHIRGYHLVKDESLVEVEQKQAELMAAFRLRAPADTVERLT